MDTLDRRFWVTFQQDLDSLTPLVEKILERADWAAEDLYTSADGIALVRATWTLFGLRDRLVKATQVTPEDKAALRDFLAGRPEWVAHPAGALDEARSRTAVGETYSDENEVREKLADSIANLIEVRSRIEAGTFRSPSELANLDHELASATELLRLIARDVRRQDQGQSDGTPPGQGR